MDTFKILKFEIRDMDIYNELYNEHSTLYSFGKFTIWKYDDKLKFDYMTFRQNDDSMKWRVRKKMWPLSYLVFY